METALQPLDAPTAIRKRRSIKSFKSDPLPPELLRELVDLTVAAPSSWNLQDWRIVLVQSPEQKAALAAAAWNQQMVVQAPVTFVFAADIRSWEKPFTEKIFAQAEEAGAWPTKAVEYFRKAIPDSQRALGDKIREYAVKDAMIAATHLVIAAESLGLATCFMNGWIEDQVKAVIGAADDPDLAIAVLVPVGYAAEPRLDPGRLPFGENVFVDRVGQPYA
jgi:nitroreductase